jgi:hypothetical protein
LKIPSHLSPKAFRNVACPDNVRVPYDCKKSNRFGSETDSTESREMPDLKTAVSQFGSAAKAKLANPGATGEPEDQLRAPLERLFADHLISVDELRAAGALDVPVAWRKSLGVERDQSPNLFEDDDAGGDEQSTRVDADAATGSDE